MSVGGEVTTVTNVSVSTTCSSSWFAIWVEDSIAAVVSVTGLIATAASTRVGTRVREGIRSRGDSVDILVSLNLNCFVDSHWNISVVNFVNKVNNLNCDILVILSLNDVNDGSWNSLVDGVWNVLKTGHWNVSVFGVNNFFVYFFLDNISDFSWNFSVFGTGNLF